MFNNRIRSRLRAIYPYSLELLEKQRYRSMKKGRVKRKLRSRMLKVIRKVFQLRDLPGGEEVEEIVITKILLQ